MIFIELWKIFQASVPNWLKEEIIKNASVMTRSSLEHPREEIDSMDEEGVDKSFEKGNQAGSKSIGSPRSTEEEDDDEVQSLNLSMFNVLLVFLSLDKRFFFPC
jgi:hypothetical protein